MKKKVLFSLLSLMFLLVLVSGCGSSDQEKLDNIDKYMKEGNYSAAKAAKERNFDDKVNYYLAQSKYYTAQNKYGDALYQLNKGTEDTKIKSDDKKVNKLKAEINSILKEHKSEIEKIRKDERESYIKLVKKLDKIQEKIDKGLDEYYNRTSSKAKLLRLYKNLNYDMPSRSIHCEGYTDEYREVDNYYSYVKKEHKYIKKLSESYSMDIEEKLLKYQEYAKEHRAKFEKLIKEEPKLY
ncbi:hypothetical protein [Anaerofustis stercorihominis]|uniref:DUF4398 domain-containing protein n=1 Tax=Anaerofustis stercorihominis TaxID=214853 RepID=A0A3E3DVK2_9FIRM|nr:hypothetical protein [Anaerofustis stercorihominis]RGD73317.1 hypothetical protein DW687_09765 [Anaerofustis stercorihominis]